MRTVIVDTWAYWELAQAGPRAAEVARSLSEADRRVTVRDAIAETFNFLSGRTRQTGLPQEWLRAVCSSGHTILDPPLEAMLGFIDGQPAHLGLSWTDLALAWAANEERTIRILTADRGFRRLGLDPVFAPPE